MSQDDNEGHVEEKKFEDEPCFIQQHQQDATFLGKVNDDDDDAEGEDDKVDHPTTTSIMEKKNHNLWSNSAAAMVSLELSEIIVSLELSEIQEFDDDDDDHDNNTTRVDDDQLLFKEEDIGAAAAAVVVSREMEDLEISNASSNSTSSSESLLASSLASDDDEASTIGSGESNDNDIFKPAAETVDKPQDSVIVNTHAIEEESKGLVLFLSSVPIPTKAKPFIETEEIMENDTFLVDDRRVEENNVQHQHELEEILAMEGLVAPAETASLNMSAILPETGDKSTLVDTPPSSPQHEFLYSEVHGTKHGESISAPNEVEGLGEEHMQQKNELEQILALESLVACDNTALDMSLSPEKDDDSAIVDSPSETPSSENEGDSQERDEDHVESPAREYSDTQMANADDVDEHSLQGASLSDCLAELEEDFASCENESPNNLNQNLEAKFPLLAAENTQPPMANATAVVSLYEFFVETEDDSKNDSPDSLQQRNVRHARLLAAGHARPLTYNDQSPLEANATNAVASLSECIAEAEEVLANDYYGGSPDQASGTDETSSPSDRLILNYPSPDKAEDEDDENEVSYAPNIPKILHSMSTHFSGCIFML